MPANRKKRDVILNYLAERFSPGQTYQEREVNAILSRHHSDFATLRRELVDGGWLVRESGIYQLASIEHQQVGEEITRLVGEAGVRWRIAHRVGRRSAANQ
ncbi:MAG: DUF2087 domain-containing protein [Candidatus Dormibacteraceae bacterium]